MGVFKPAIVRTGVDLSSERVGDVAPGSVVTVVEYASLADGSRRARIESGWLTSVTKDGRANLEPPSSRAAIAAKREIVVKRVSLETKRCEN